MRPHILNLFRVELYVKVSTMIRVALKGLYSHSSLVLKLPSLLPFSFSSLLVNPHPPFFHNFLMYHLAASGMEIITVVHMMPYLLFYSIYGCQTLRSGKSFFEDSNEYLSTLHDGFQKYLRGVSALEVACDDVQTLLNDNDPVNFLSGHDGCSVSALATQMFYPGI